MMLGHCIAELCIEIPGHKLCYRELTDMLSVAAEPSAGGPGDDLGPPPLAAALFRAQSSAPSYLDVGPLLERCNRVNPHLRGGGNYKTEELLTAHAGRNPQPARRCSACPWGAGSSREQHWGCRAS